MRVVLGAITAILLAAPVASAAPVLYAIDDANNSLITIDPSTLAVKVVGSTGVATGDFGDLTYDSNHGVLYWAAGRGNDSLYTIDPNTGLATLVGVHGVDDLFGLAYDTANNTLYGDSTSGNFYSINTATGAATLIGSNGVYPGGLVYVASSDTLYLTSAGPGALYTVNTATGGTTLFSGGPGFLDDNGITWDPVDNVFWTDDWSHLVYQYDPTFTSRTQKLLYSDPLDGIAFVGGAAPVPEPASMALIGAGLAGLGFARRRKA